MQNFTRTDVAFVSSGTRCAAWLYRPQGVAWPPVVVMAHGFGAERSFGLPQFAERFAAAGWAAFLFDYRTFGASDGQPRNLVSPRWGTSLSGGHVLVLAAEDPGIATIVSQVPFVDPVASARQLGISYSIRACVAGLRDWLRAITFRRPYYVPVYGPPGTLACLATADAAEGYRAMVPPDSEWRNACPARCLLATLFYRPHSAAPRVRCPALLVVAEQDTLSPAWVVRQTAQAMPAATLLALPGGHFSVYQGPTLETVIAAEIDFLRKQFAG
jgi:pimeloyl-ACP methyl ester carboxylesterase